MFVLFVSVTIRYFDLSQSFSLPTRLRIPTVPRWHAANRPSRTGEPGPLSDLRRSKSGSLLVPQYCDTPRMKKVSPLFPRCGHQLACQETHPATCLELWMQPQSSITIQLPSIHLFSGCVYCIPVDTLTSNVSGVRRQVIRLNHAGF